MTHDPSREDIRNATRDPGSGPEASPFARSVTGWHRLDARVLIVRAVREIRSLLSLLVGLVIFGTGSTWYLVLSGSLVVLGILSGVGNWALTRYRITDRQIDLRTGLFVRRRLSVSRDRIRTVDLHARLTHRLLKLAVIQMGTGQPSEGLTLDAVSAAEAKRLRQQLLGSSAPAADLAAPRSVLGATADIDTCQTTPAEDRLVTSVAARLAALDLRWLRYAPLTRTGIISVGVLYSLVAQFRDEPDLELIAATFAWIKALPPWLAVATLIAGVPLLASAVSVGGYLCLYWRYRLTREPDATIQVEQGLFTTRSVTIDADRIRGAAVVEPLMLRAVRGARATVVTTGITTAGSDLLLPPAPVAEAHRVCGAVLDLTPADPGLSTPELTGLGSPTLGPLRRHPGAALRRQILASIRPILTGTVLLAIAASDWIWRWPFAWTVPLPFGWTWSTVLTVAWSTALALVPFVVLLGWDRYRSLGHALTHRYLVARTGSSKRVTVALQRTGIIGWDLTQTFFQRRSGLLTLSAITAAGAGVYHVVDIDADDGLALADQAVPGLLRPFLATDAGISATADTTPDAIPAPAAERASSMPGTDS